MDGALCPVTDEKRVLSLFLVAVFCENRYRHFRTPP